MLPLPQHYPMKRILLYFLLIPGAPAFGQQPKSELMYSNDKYQLYTDKIVESDNTATVVSRDQIVSVYRHKGDSVSEKTTWNRRMEIGQKPQFRSDVPIVDAIYNLTVEESMKNIERDSTFRTGMLWGGVWTRDISYSVWLGMAYQDPEISKISLMKKVRRGRIIQDTGSGGSWPVSSDRMAWAMAAWEVYKVTGDEDWLRTIYPIIKNSIDDDFKVIYDPKTGLYKGESSFLDWRDQTYPKWMNNVDIAESECLGTNVVHYSALRVLVDISKHLKLSPEPYLKRAEALKASINRNLWMKDRGYYSQYLYGKPNLNQSPRMEGLGEALAVLYDISTKEQNAQILSKVPLTDFGITCIYPNIPGIRPYHNNAIWPFVQMYWNLAAAKAGNFEALEHGMASIYRLSGLFLSNYENFDAETGDVKGPAINSERQLWSIGANLAMVHRLLLGMSFEENGIRFNPAIPYSYGKFHELKNFRYRDATLDITVNGTANVIKTIKLDGIPLPSNFLPAPISGHHHIEIEMEEVALAVDKINLVKNEYSLTAPESKLIDSKLVWNKVPGAEHYLLYRNGVKIAPIKDTSFNTDIQNSAEYKISAVDKNGWESFTSKPLVSAFQKNISLLECEFSALKSDLTYTDFSGEGFIESSTELNTTINIKYNAPRTGRYLIDFRYSNGSGSWISENKCANRSLYINDFYTGTLVFPQRGQDTWSDWDFSNSYYIELKKGDNDIRLSLENWNNNMNYKVNRMMLDYARVIYIPQ